MDLGNVASLGYFLPELLITFGILAIVLIDLAVTDKSRLGYLALVVAIGVLIKILAEAGTPAAALFNRMIVFDSFALFFRALIAIAAVIAVWMSIGSKEVKSCDQGEYYAILLSSTLAMFLMASADNLLMAYLSLEFVSLTSYILTGFLRHNRRSQEAALKYLIYGGVASGTMIYGMSWIFGIAGSIDFAAINRALSAGGHGSALAVFIALVLILTGMGYKVASVPFHMWAPDVYTGAPIPITTFLAIGSKAAGFALLTRFFYPAISHLAARRRVDRAGGRRLAATAAGDVHDHDDARQSRRAAADQHEAAARLFQYRAGRLRADGPGGAVQRRHPRDAVLHAGLLCDGRRRVSGRHDRRQPDRARGYRRPIADSPGAAESSPRSRSRIFLFSLTGIPLTVGFIGKFYLFAAVIRGQFYMLGDSRNPQFGSVALLLCRSDSHHVPRPAHRRRGRGHGRALELRPDGGAGRGRRSCWDSTGRR